MRVVDYSLFLRLSVEANYLLTASEEIDERLLRWLVGPAGLSHWTREHQTTVLEAVRYVREAYLGQRRRLGPTAALHPLRTAALLSDAGATDPELVMLALLHDQLEDIRIDKQGEVRWRELEQRFQGLIKRLSPEGEWYLMEKLEVLTRRGGESYTEYLDRIVSRGAEVPDLVRVKAADRLDNTFDLWVFGACDPLEGVDFFEAALHVLALSRASISPAAEFSLEPFPISKRLSELYKSVALLSLARGRGVGRDPVAAALLARLVHAGLAEAQRVLLVGLACDWPDPRQQRRILLETLDYCSAGGVEALTPTGGHRLDGLCRSHFDVADPQRRRSALQALDQDKELRTAAAIGFVAVFLGLKHDPAFHTRGLVPETARVA